MTKSLAPPDGAATQPSIAIIGLGRVGRVLGRALYAAGYHISAVSSRDSAKAAAFATAIAARALPQHAAVRAADLVLLTVSDDAIPLVAAELAQVGAWRSGQAVVHASGASPASVLHAVARQGAAIGSFHPLAAIASADHELPRGLTFGIEAAAPLDALLSRMARDLGGYPLPLAPGTKTLYHAAAVIASNYTVTLASLAAQLFERLGATPEEGLRALLPLMRTTIDNLERQGLPGALTGPLVRGDVGTVSRHLLALDDRAPEVASLYRCLAIGTLPLAQQRGVDAEAIGALQDMIRLPGELILEREVEVER